MSLQEPPPTPYPTHPPLLVAGTHRRPPAEPDTQAQSERSGRLCWSLVPEWPHSEGLNHNELCFPPKSSFQPCPPTLSHHHSTFLTKAQAPPGLISLHLPWAPLPWAPLPPQSLPGAPWLCCHRLPGPPLPSVWPVPRAGLRVHDGRAGTWLGPLPTEWLVPAVPLPPSVITPGPTPTADLRVPCPWPALPGGETSKMALSFL